MHYDHDGKLRLTKEEQAVLAGGFGTVSFATGTEVVVTANADGTSPTIEEVLRRRPELRGRRLKITIGPPPPPPEPTIRPCPNRLCREGGAIEWRRGPADQYDDEAPIVCKTCGASMPSLAAWNAAVRIEELEELQEDLDIARRELESEQIARQEHDW